MVGGSSGHGDKELILTQKDSIRVTSFSYKAQELLDLGVERFLSRVELRLINICTSYKLIFNALAAQRISFAEMDKAILAFDSTIAFIADIEQKKMLTLLSEEGLKSCRDSLKHLLNIMNLNEVKIKDKKYLDLLFRMEKEIVALLALFQKNLTRVRAKNRRNKIEQTNA